MGFLDEAKNLAGKAEQEMKEHPDKIKEALQKAEGVVNEKTGGKYTDQLATAEQKAEGYIDKQS